MLPRLVIYWPSSVEFSDPSNDTPKKSPLRLCNQFGRLLVNNSGLWATGPFVSVTCLEEKAAASTKAVEDQNNWSLHFPRRDDGFSMELFYLRSSKNRLKIATVSLPPNISPGEVLGSRTAASLLAYKISLEMPFSSIKSLKWFKQSPAYLEAASDKRVRFRSRDLSPTKTHIVYTISEVDGVWKPKIVGSMSQDEGHKSNRSSRWILKKKIEKYTVKAVESGGGPLEAESDSPRFYAISPSDNRELLLASVNQELSQILEMKTHKKLTFGRYIYTGFRLGVPVIQSDSPLSRSFMYGIFTEVRSGLLSGVRLNYDWIPEKSLTEETSTTKASWSRFQVGYALGLSLNNPILNWIDLTPRLGVTNLVAETVEQSEFGGSGIITRFEQKGAPTSGIEIGLERRFGTALIRLWGYAALSTGISSSDKAFSTKSTRFGVDHYLQILDLDELKVALVGFGYVDRTEITRKKSSEVEEVKASPGISYANSYLGAGVSVAY